MPKLRYYEIVRYYRYIVGKVTDRRAFEVRVVIAVPEDWDEDRIKKSVELREFMDSAMLDALDKAFPPSVAGDELRNILMDDVGWGKLKVDKEYPAITSGFEATEDTVTILTKKDLREKIVEGEEDSQMLRYSMEETRLPFVSSQFLPEWRKMRGRLGGLTKRKKSLETKMVDARDEIVESVQFMVIDKTRRYSLKLFPYEGYSDWTVPES